MEQTQSTENTENIDQLQNLIRDLRLGYYEDTKYIVRCPKCPKGQDIFQSNGEGVSKIGILYSNLDGTKFDFRDSLDGDEYRCIICPSSHVLPIVWCENEKSGKMLSYVQLIEL